VRNGSLAPGASQVHVTADGTGDFCTVQGAIDYVPGANTTPVTINVARGTYREIVEIQTKHNITIHGEDRNESVISYPNSAALQTPPGGTSMGTKFRALFGIDTSNDIVIENITIWNPSPQLSTNGQSEALRSEGGRRIILRNATFKGLQDTFLLTGQVYVADSIVEGDTDFIWGGGAVYFDHCEIKVVGKKGYNVQARNGLGAFGYVFVGCSLTSVDGITGHYLARTDKNTTSPASQVAYVDCSMGPHIAPAGWLIDGYPRPAADAGAPDGGTGWNLSGLRFQEYHSLDPSGAPLDVSQRIPEAIQLSDQEAAQLRDVGAVFGDWNPKAAPGDAGTD
jgi:pectin methylesterase-like acyl-CoA thioesterase